MITKITFGILLLAVQIHGFTQNEYFPDGAAWGIEHGVVGSFGWNGSARRNVDGEITFNGIVYKKIFQEGYVIPSAPSGIDPYNYSDTEPFGYFRSEGKKCTATIRELI